MILLIVLYGFYLLYLKIHTREWLICSTLIIGLSICVYLHIYGLFTKQYCFHSEKRVSQAYHFIMHMAGSIAHHIIVFL